MIAGEENERFPPTRAVCAFTSLRGANCVTGARCEICERVAADAGLSLKRSRAHGVTSRLELRVRREVPPHQHPRPLSQGYRAAILQREPVMHERLSKMKPEKRQFQLLLASPSVLFPDDIPW